MLDLFSGLNGASKAMRNRGWKVIGVDNNPSFNPEIVADIATWSWHGKRPDLLWASPPCTEFSKLDKPWYPHDKEPNMSLICATKRIIDETNPCFWVVENVRGSRKYIVPLLGPVTKKAGSRYLWGNFPVFDVDSEKCYGKMKISHNRSTMRSIIPYVISLNLALAIEAYS